MHKLMRRIQMKDSNSFKYTLLFGLTLFINTTEFIDLFEKYEKYTKAN